MTRRLPPKGEITEMTTSVPQKQTKTAPITATARTRAAKRRFDATPSKAKPARKATGAKKPFPFRRGSKTAKILDLLKRPGGATLKELTKATGWQAHSVRGFLSGTIGKKMGTPVESSKHADAERVYLISPK
jgi:uncharacterized protein DUF3489